MVKPDIIITMPYGIESPYLRWFTRHNQHNLGKVIIGYYNDHRKYDFREFLKDQMPDAIHVDTGEVTGRDWRDQTVNACLKHSNSEWIIFLEDDFVFGENTLFALLEQAEDYDVIGYGDMGKWCEAIRLHPAFIMVRRKAVDRTSKDFGAYPEKNRDHFATFTEELYKLGDLRYLDISNCNWTHLKGTYSNYFLVLEGKQPNYNPEKFREYVKMTLELPDLVWDERFRDWSNECLR